MFTRECHIQLPLLQKQSNKKESRVEQKTKINMFSDYSLILLAMKKSFHGEEKKAVMMGPRNGNMVIIKSKDDMISLGKIN